MRFTIILFLMQLLGTSACFAQIPDGLSDVAVWIFVNNRLYSTGTVDDIATYLNPQYCKRAWFKYDGILYNYFSDSALSLWTVPPLLNDYGALFEGGVQVACLDPDAGWPCDNEYDDDHLPPYRIPDPVFDDFTTRNADDSIYWVPNIFDHQVCHASIANENFLDFVLYWAFEQIDVGVNALEFDEISGAYGFTYGVPGDNPNEGYDDYAIGTANFATKLSVVCGRGMVDPIEWFMPTASASSITDSAQLAFDGDFNTFWHSDTGDSHWIEIDFGRTRTIQQIYLKFPVEHIISNFVVDYWNGTSWCDFDPPISVIENTEATRSFLVEPARAKRVRFTSGDSVLFVAEMQLFGRGFRQFLLRRYCSDSGWTSTDLRWETEKLVDFSDTLQCPDGTMNTFNYREYLCANGWTLNPFGDDIDTLNYLNPLNPLFLDWFPGKYCKSLTTRFCGDTATFNAIMDLYHNSYSYERLFLTFWRAITDSVRNYASHLGREIYITNNGSALLPHYVDYLLSPMGDGAMFPNYTDPSPSDSMMTHLDGTQAQINLWRDVKTRGINYLGRDVPIVAFLDYGHQGMPFAHLGGQDEPADERAEYLKIYPMEMYAAGVKFCFPVFEPGLNSWADTLSDGTRLIEIIKIQTDFLNTYSNFYRNVLISEYESLVTVNGVVPFNGAWNIDWEHGMRIDSPVNDSKVTIAYTESEIEERAYLHIINHNWDSISHRMLPQDSVPVTVPVSDTCRLVMLVSPDFNDTIYPAFTYDTGTINFSIPLLEYYVIAVLDFSDTTKIDDEKIEKPLELYLFSYPNPFNSSVAIYVAVGRTFLSVGGDERTEMPVLPCEVEICDLRGNVVVSEWLQPSADATWKFIWTPGEDTPSGLYLVRLRMADGREITQRAVYLK